MHSADATARTSFRNARGEWVPSIPVPFLLLFGRARCSCGRKYRNLARYSAHYALAHIVLGTEPL